MSLLNNVRQTLTEVTENVVEQGKQLGTQAQLQLTIKKLQLERAKRLHELGNRTYRWHQSGTLMTSGQVPPEVVDVCRHLDEVHRQLAETERQLEEAKLQAQQAQQVGSGFKSAPTVTATVVVSTPDAASSPVGSTATAASNGTDHVADAAGATGPGSPGPGPGS